MEFRILLKILEGAFHSSSFVLKDVMPAIYSSHLIGRTLAKLNQTGHVSIPRPKIISKDLDRLYKMGFLSRIRMKRKVRTKTSKFCNRGVEYRYSLNRQGHSYVSNYLLNPNPNRTRKEFENYADLLMHEYAKRKASSPEEAEAGWELYRQAYPARKLRPIDKRFPANRDPRTLELLLRVTRERDQLKRDLLEIRKQLEDLKRRYL